jgi:hypothetical protein
MESLNGGFNHEWHNLARGLLLFGRHDRCDCLMSSFNGSYNGMQLSLYDMTTHDHVALPVHGQLFLSLNY